VLDAEHTGQFTLERFFEFAVLCQTVQDRLRIHQENFLIQFQGYCTVILWVHLAHHGTGAFVQWICTVLQECDRAREALQPSSPLNESADEDVCPSSELYLSRDTLALLHEVFHISRSFGYDFQACTFAGCRTDLTSSTAAWQAFFDLLQRAAEEQGLLDLSNESLDEFVPVAVVAQVAEQFAAGLTAVVTKVRPPSSTGVGRGLRCWVLVGIAHVSTLLAFRQVGIPLPRPAASPPTSPQRAPPPASRLARSQAVPGAGISLGCRMRFSGADLPVASAPLPEPPPPPAGHPPVLVHSQPTSPLPFGYRRGEVGASVTGRVPEANEEAVPDMREFDGVSFRPIAAAPLPPRVAPPIRVVNGGSPQGAEGAPDGSFHTESVLGAAARSSPWETSGSGSDPAGGTSVSSEDPEDGRRRVEARVKSSPLCATTNAPSQPPSRLLPRVPAPSRATFARMAELMVAGDASCAGAGPPGAGVGTPSGQGGRVEELTGEGLPHAMQGEATTSAEGGRQTLHRPHDRGNASLSAVAPPSPLPRSQPVFPPSHLPRPPQQSSAHLHARRASPPPPLPAALPLRAAACTAPAGAEAGLGLGAVDHPTDDDALTLSDEEVTAASQRARPQRQQGGAGRGGETTATRSVRSPPAAATVSSDTRPDT